MKRLVNNDMKIYVPIFDQYEELIKVDKERNKVVTLFRGHLENEYDLDDIEFIDED